MHMEFAASRVDSTPTQSSLSMDTIKLALRKCNRSKLSFFKSGWLKPTGSATENNRYDVCKLLADRQISNVIWFEDLLALHGSNTQVWDLHLLVEDPKAAAKLLLQDGYKETIPDSRFGEDPEFKRAARIIHSQSSTAVVLHIAREWYYQLDNDVQDFLPPLHRFLDSMIEFWLNISAQDYVDRLLFALYIGCLINYCYYLQSPEGELVKSPSYAENLKPEHREVHYNIVSENPKEESFTTTRRHIYHVMRSKEIKDGIFVPKPYKKGGFREALATVAEQ